LLCCILSTFSLAQVPRWVGIDSRIANNFAVAQWQDEWCWAASTQLILNYYGIPVTQAAIVNRIHGNFADQAGSDFDISASLNGWVPTTNGMRIVHAEEAPGLPMPADLIEELSQGHPILIAFATGPSSGHAVVITAAAYVQTAAGPVVTSLVLRDPWPSPQNRASIGRVQLNNLDLAQFARLVRANWIVSATDVAQQPDAGAAATQETPAKTDDKCESDYKECVSDIQSLSDCMDEKTDKCMTSCLGQYRYPEEACRGQFCNPNIGANQSWAGVCRQEIRNATQECKDTRHECRSE